MPAANTAQLPTASKQTTLADENKRARWHGPAPDRSNCMFLKPPVMQLDCVGPGSKRGVLLRPGIRVLGLIEMQMGCQARW